MKKFSIKEKKPKERKPFKRMKQPVREKPFKVPKEVELPTPDQLAAVNIHLFLEHEQITNDQGGTLDFKEHAFLWDIYEDLTPRQAILKAAQIGFSTLANIKCIWLARNKKMDIIYSLPTSDDARQFVSGKTNRLIANNPVFQKWTQDHDTIEQKKIGDNMLYFRGTWIEKAAIMIPADMYVADEVDRSKQDTVKLFQSRLQHSKFAWEWYFSNPSAPGVGVDQWWQRSDQKHYFYKCEGCNEQQYLTMDNVFPHGFCCKKCGKVLNRKKGEWVARWRDRSAEISGYWISLLMCPWVSSESILEKQATQSEEQFTNFVLGQPYVGKGNTLTSQLLFSNLTDNINPQEDRTIIGVDNGNKITMVIGNKKGLFYNGEVTDFSVLETLMVKYPNAMMCIDPHGNEIATRKLQERFMGRVYRVYSTTPRKSDQVAKWNDQDMTVLIDRDKIIQLVVDEFTERRIPLQGKREDWWDYWIHWSRLHRIVEVNPFGIETFHWAKSDTPCDFPFATFYWRVMMDRFFESSVSFRDPNLAQAFAQQGMEIRPNMTTEFMPKWRI